MILEFNDKIENYFDKKYFHIKNTPENKYFGVELEVECSKGDREDVSDKVKPLIDDFAIIKHDGSLFNGFEIVSIPLTIKDHADKWDKFLGTAEKLKLVSYNSPRCGMHVHFSKDELTTLQIAKIIKFVINVDNYIFIKKIAQRCNVNHANFKKIPDFQYASIENKSYPLNNKYLAINILPSKTIEFRLFRGTLNKISFLKNLEFCSAIIDFTSNSSMSMEDATNWWKFAEFVKNNEHKYPLLNKFCVDKQIDTPEARAAFLELKKARKEKLNKGQDTFAIHTAQMEDNSVQEGHFHDVFEQNVN